MFSWRNKKNYLEVCESMIYSGAATVVTSQQQPFTYNSHSLLSQSAMFLYIQFKKVLHHFFFTLFPALFVIQYMNLCQQSGFSNLIGCQLEKGVVSKFIQHDKG